MYARYCMYTYNSMIPSPSEGGPRVLWSLFFNLSLCLVADPVSATPGGVYVTSDPDTSLNYEGAVKEVRSRSN